MPLPNNINLDAPVSAPTATAYSPAKTAGKAARVAVPGGIAVVIAGYLISFLRASYPQFVFWSVEQDPEIIGFVSIAVTAALHAAQNWVKNRATASLPDSVKEMLDETIPDQEGKP